MRGKELEHNLDVAFTAHVTARLAHAQSACDITAKIIQF